MLHYAVVFLVVALVAALLGFGGIAASVLFIVFIVLAAVSVALGLFKPSSSSHWLS